MSRKAVNVISFLCAFVFMLILCFSCPYLSDDWHNFFIFKGYESDEFNERIKNIGDVFISLRNAYNLNGGRMYASFLALILNFFGKYLFNVLNSAVFALLGFLIYRMASYAAGSAPKYMLPVIYILMTLFLPSFGDTMLWMSGSLVYLWMGTSVLGTVLIYIKYEEKQNTAWYIILCVSAFLAGAANEISGGMIFVLAACYFFLKKKKPPLKLLLPAVLMIAGMCSILLAPGNVQRSHDLSSLGIMTINSYFMIFPLYALFFAEKYLALIAVMLIINIFLCPGSKGNAASYSLAAAGAAGFAALPLSGTFAERPVFTAAVFILVSFFISLINLVSVRGKELMTPLIKTALGVIIGGVCVYLGFNAAEYLKITAGYNEREKMIKEAGERGEDIVFDVDYYRQINYNNFFIPNVSMDVRTYTYEWEGAYYGIRIIIKEADGQKDGLS